MNNKYCGFVPFRTERDWFENALEIANQERPAEADGIDWHDCTGCMRHPFREDELSPETGYCADCDELKGEA